MKKLFSLAVLGLACTLYSCSGEGVTPQAGGEIVAAEIGGQSGQLPTPPPPGTKP